MKQLVLIDLSNIAHATFFTAMKEKKLFYSQFSQDQYFQYLMYKRLKDLKKMCPNSEVVIAIDSSSWRKKEFKYYKAKRKLARAKSKYDMNIMFAGLNKTIKELKEYFPYKTIQVHNAEADDIIGTLVCYFKNSGRKIIIISRDRDFMQLQRVPRVTQFDPVSRKWIKCDDPYHYLTSHIISGDSGDGIPNILSDEDTFVANNKRQKTCGEKKIGQILDQGLKEFFKENEGTEDRYNKNRKLVELSEAMIPEELREEIIFLFNNYKKSDMKPYMKLIKYFSENEHLSKLSENVFDFI